MRRLTGLIFMFVVIAMPVRAEKPVALELVLLADATGSIDAAEIQFQREGYAEAITHPDVLDAISFTGPVAVIYIEWADSLSQHVVADWAVIDNEASAKAFATALLKPPREAYGRNAIGSALLFGKSQIEGNDFKGARRVIDLSADSANNWNGPSIEEARAEVLAVDITINGLAVLCRGCSGRPISYDLEEAFEERIVGGPNAFVVTADSAETFSIAVRRKLVLEISNIEQPKRYAIQR